MAKPSERVSGAGRSGGRRTERTGLTPEVDVAARHEELSCTHVAMVGAISDKVNLLNRE